MAFKVIQGHRGR